MKNLKSLVLVACGSTALLVAGCVGNGNGSGGTVSNTTVNTPYSSTNLFSPQNYSLTQIGSLTTGSCSLTGDSIITCSRSVANGSGNGTFNGYYTVKFTSGAPASVQLPPAYVLVPPTTDGGNTLITGLNFTAGPNGTSCNQFPNGSGADEYTCTFQISSNGTAESGTTYLYTVGSGGTQVVTNAIIKIIVQ